MLPRYKRAPIWETSLRDPLRKRSYLLASILFGVGKLVSCLSNGYSRFPHHLHSRRHGLAPAVQRRVIPKHHFDDANLDNRSSTVRARGPFAVQYAPFQGDSDPCGVVYGVSFGMLKEMVLCRALLPSRNVVIDTAREGVVAGCADLSVGANNHGAKF